MPRGREAGFQSFPLYHIRKEDIHWQRTTCGPKTTCLSVVHLWLYKYSSSFTTDKAKVRRSTFHNVVRPFFRYHQIIDIVGENNDTNLLKELALVSHSFLQICNKHLFATIELHDAVPRYHIASSKRGFLKLLKNRPSVVKYIRKLTYREEYKNPNLLEDDRILFPFLPDFLRTIPRLNCLAITTSQSLAWDEMDPSLISALLHLMQLPTVNHIDISYISVPLSILTLSVNMHRLDFRHTEYDSEDDDSEEDDTEYDDDSPDIVQSEPETMPRICEFYTSQSTKLTTKLLHAKRQDGQPAFDFTDLRQLSMSLDQFQDKQNLRYLLQNSKLLEKVHFSGFGSMVLHDILSPIARTLKVLDLTVSLRPGELEGLCKQLKTMAGHYRMLKALSFKVRIDGDSDDHEETENASDMIGTTLQKLGEVLVKPGWSALRQVSFNVSIPCCGTSREEITKLSEELHSLPDEYPSHLSKLESVSFNYSVVASKCQVPSMTLCDTGGSWRLPEV